MSSKPGLGRRGLSIRQQGDDPAPFQIADNAGVPVIAPPGPIVNADNPDRVGWRTATASDYTQERVFAHRQHQSLCEACRRSTTKCQTEMMNDRVQSCRAARRRCQYAFGKTLREDLAAAQNCIAAEPMGDNQELDGPPCERKVGYTASIAAMDTSRNRSAGRTETDTSRHPDRDDSLITLVAPLSTTNPRGTRLERWSACCMALILLQSKRQTPLKLHQK
jgi:hypothetical protein